jgi:hypothetical protein
MLQRLQSGGPFQGRQYKARVGQGERRERKEEERKTQQKRGGKGEDTKAEPRLGLA